MIRIIDYGLGNIKAIYNVYKRLNISVGYASKPDMLEGCTHLILPGVGSFDSAMGLLENSSMYNDIKRLVVSEKIPLLGICIGMQMLAEASEEGKKKGLGWIGGSVQKIGNSNGRVRVPHMGWNNIHVEKKSQLLSGLEEGARFYFLHSYHFSCSDSKNVLASTSYGSKISSVVENGNIYGVQFHHEKSHQFGEILLKNFSEIR